MTNRHCLPRYTSYPPSPTVQMPPKQSWQALSADRKQKQLHSIPQEWIIHTPATHGDPDHNSNAYARQSVIHVPETCGLLSPLDVEITNTIDLDILLGNMATSRWSAVQVTTAFCKRAIIAHQLVLYSLSFCCFSHVWCSSFR